MGFCCCMFAAMNPEREFARQMKSLACPTGSAGEPDDDRDVESVYQSVVVGQTAGTLKDRFESIAGLPPRQNPDVQWASLRSRDWAGCDQKDSKHQAKDPKDALLAQLQDTVVQLTDAYEAIAAQLRDTSVLADFFLSQAYALGLKTTGVPAEEIRSSLRQQAQEAATIVCASSAPTRQHRLQLEQLAEYRKKAEDQQRIISSLQAQNASCLGTSARLAQTADECAATIVRQTRRLDELQKEVAKLRAR